MHTAHLPSISAVRHYCYVNSDASHDTFTVCYTGKIIFIDLVQLNKIRIVITLLSPVLVNDTQGPVPMKDMQTPKWPS